MARSVTEDITVADEQVARTVVATSRGVRTRAYDVTVNGQPAGTIVKETKQATRCEWVTTDNHSLVRYHASLYRAMSHLARRYVKE